MMMLAYHDANHIRASVLVKNTDWEWFTWMMNRIIGFFES
jgi:hypothetical protein